MIAVDENALICDLAETYRIYDYKDMPPEKVAILAVGLGHSSRIKTKISGLSVPLNLYLLGLIADDLRIISWQIAGGKSKSKPNLITEIWNKKEDSDSEEFDSVNDFERRRKALLNQIERREYDG